MKKLQSIFDSNEKYLTKVVRSQLPSGEAHQPVEVGLTKKDSALLKFFLEKPAMKTQSNLPPTDFSRASDRQVNIL